MKRSILFAAACIAATQATAHATLEVQSAEAGTTYKAVMRIGHGCKGEDTQRLDITIPEGVIAVKPMPKAGWTLTTETGAYDKSYDYYGHTLTEGVKTITWEGMLSDSHYDEFVFRARLAGEWEPGTVLYFPTVQTCANGVSDWIAIPAAGQDPHDLPNPAPGLTIKEGHHGGHKH